MHTVVKSIQNPAAPRREYRCGAAEGGGEQGRGEGESERENLLLHWAAWQREAASSGSEKKTIVKRKKVPTHRSTPPARPMTNLGRILGGASQRTRSTARIADSKVLEKGLWRNGHRCIACQDASLDAPVSKSTKNLTEGQQDGRRSAGVLKRGG